MKCYVLLYLPCNMHPYLNSPPVSFDLLNLQLTFSLWCLSPWSWKKRWSRVMHLRGEKKTRRGEIRVGTRGLKGKDKRIHREGAEGKGGWKQRCREKDRLVNDWKQKMGASWQKRQGRWREGGGVVVLVFAITSLCSAVWAAWRSAASPKVIHHDYVVVGR